VEAMQYFLQINPAIKKLGYMKKMPLHHSQKIISIDKLKNEMTVIIKIKLLPYSENANTVFKRAPELSFLLGRFRDFFEIVN
jgi:hypothetical protein